MDKLQDLGEQIRACHEYAADAKQKAEATVDPESRASLLDIEKRWLALARNYALIESLGAPSVTTSAPRDSEERFRWFASIVDSSDDAIISKNLDGIITSWNKGAERLFGYTAEEAVGKSITILIPADRRDEEHMILDRIGRGEPIEHYETVRERKDGSSIVISLTVSPVRNAEGRIVGASKIARDITERKHAEAREKELMDELTYMNRVATAGELSASIAHEVTQPLTAIATMALAARRWLAGEKLDIDRIRDTLDHIENSSRRATEIITNVRSMFTKDTYEKVGVDVNDLIRKGIALVAVELGKRKIELQLELGDRLPPVLANWVQLQQVVLNLVMNAIDAMNSVQPRVLFVKSKLSRSDSIHVSIEDTGIGIDPAHVDKIFTPLFTTKEHGMGMGLSICHSIIESHSGRIWVSPAGNRGSIFQFELPIIARSGPHDGRYAHASQPIHRDAKPPRETTTGILPLLRSVHSQSSGIGEISAASRGLHPTE